MMKRGMWKVGCGMLLCLVMMAGVCFGDVDVMGLQAKSLSHLAFGVLVCFSISCVAMAFALAAGIQVFTWLSGLFGKINLRKGTLLLVLGLLFGAACMQPVQAAPPVSVEVGPMAVKVLPERNLSLSYGTIWSATNSVAQGDILRWSNQHYMARSAGTLSTNVPDTTVIGVQTNGTVILSYVEKGPRLGFVLQLQDAGSVRINHGSAAVPSIGIQIEGAKSIWQESGRGSPQGAIWVVSDSGTNTVSALEW